jgi:hypothetical protein
VEFLLSLQTGEGDIRGIYGNQYATTYVGAILELVVKAGYADDPRVGATFDWLLATRQSDGGWAIPTRTCGLGFRDGLDLERYPEPLTPDVSKPFSHLVTGMVLARVASVAIGITLEQATRKQLRGVTYLGGRESVSSAETMAVNQNGNETRSQYRLKIVRAGHEDLPWWICLAVHRSLRRWRLSLPSAITTRVRP